MRQLIVILPCVLVLPAFAASLSIVTNVEVQPLAAQVARVTEALAYLGAPLSDAELKQIKDAPALHPPKPPSKSRPSSTAMCCSA
jgi:hypothetical protein